MLQRAFLRRTLRRPGPLLAVAFAAGVVVALVFVGLLLQGQDGPTRAVIVDQLSLTHPNPDFREQATSLLQEAGFTVDYYSGEEATVRLYQNLARQNYAYVILRSHSALIPDYRIGFAGPSVRGDLGLFTAEPASQTRYVDEQRTFRLSYGSYLDGGSQYFSVGSRLIASSSGEFDDATVVIMGCEGLAYSHMADAFLEKGAKEVVGWDGLVAASHTDTATERLLERLLVDGLSAGEAVAQTMAEVGSDPTYDSSLLSYPPGGA